MNERIKELALDAGLLNYVDHETPRRYFVHGHADLEEVEKFAELIVQECAVRVDFILREKSKGGGTMGDEIREHFGVEQ
jgi:hypothetical protein